VLPTTAPDVRLRDARDVVELLAETINQVRRGEIDPKVANAVGYLGALMLRAMETTVTISRIAALEAVIAGQPVISKSQFDEDHEESVLGEIT